MASSAPKTIWLKDYRSPVYRIDSLDLSFDLDEVTTRVSARLAVEKNISEEADLPLVLDGVGLKLLRVAIDGKDLEPSQYHVDEKSLSLFHVPRRFILEIENEINPSQNKALEGLYQSGAMLCTQNEPEGFRHITYFLDRPDVMAKFRTRIVADKQRYPVLLSNGNEIEKGDLPGGKHWVQWEDPFRKPCYLFALVAGDLGCVRDVFTTRSKRTIDLRLYCDKGNESKCAYGLQSLKKAMKWDEEVFGLECDLDVYMIVAVDSFNFGAMENKGLNIFNTRCVFAQADTSTDENFLRVESVIAHEYFHNWTGNRVTCRDWFQLTLKEGLTVFRDQEFAADMHSKAVNRIQNVISLRGRQFEEDASPMAHPVKPKSYMQINNFYTATVYEKGAEVIRMIRTLIGKEAFRRGMDKYFELYDGQAVTTEDFVHAMALASGRNFTQFSRWYDQAGTPDVYLYFDYDSKRRSFSLTVEQNGSPTADGSSKEPWHFPFAVGLLGEDGRDLPLYLAGQALPHTTVVLDITQSQQTFVFEKVTSRPIPSVNRHFSAPVKVHAPYSRDDYLFLMAHDSDEFNRWEAGQELTTLVLLELVKDFTLGRSLQLKRSFVEAFGKILAEESLDLSLQAMLLTLPSENTLALRQQPIAIEANHFVRNFVIKELAKAHRGLIWERYHELRDQGPYELDQRSLGRRSLKNVCLEYLVRTQEPSCLELCMNQFTSATNMTDELAALTILSNVDCTQRLSALSAFYQKWKRDTLVMNKWLAVQAGSQLPHVLERVRELEADPIFDITVPNLVRALFGTFSQNLLHFHAKDGKGYALLVDKILEIDPLNPHIAAGLAGAFKQMDRLDDERRQRMRQELEHLLEASRLSSNVFEVVSKTLHRELKEEQ